MHLISIFLEVLATPYHPFKPPSKQGSTRWEGFGSSVQTHNASINKEPLTLLHFHIS